MQQGTIAERIEAQLGGARLRVLIVGAGIAGATLAALLRQRGEPAAIVERHGPRDAQGYMLGVLPLGGRVLNGLGLRRQYLDYSHAMTRWALHGASGKLIRDYDLTEIADRFGLYRGIERRALLDLLRDAAGPIEYGASVTAVEQQGDAASVTFSDGSASAFDLVVVADGIHSHTRAMVFDEGTEIEHFDTGWGGHVLWCETMPGAEGTYREMWSAGRMIGVYPVPGRAGIFLGGRGRAIADSDPFALADELLRGELPEEFRHAFRTVDRSQAPVYWPMADIRAKNWWRGRTVLLGDAAAAFLPTAGVGASAAMDSAAALADELARADAGHIDYALSLYENRQRRRVELAQKNSRTLSRAMFVNSPLAAFLRDQAMRFYSLEMMMRDIAKVMEGKG